MNSTVKNQSKKRGCLFKTKNRGEIPRKSERAHTRFKVGCALSYTIEYVTAYGKGLLFSKRQKIAESLKKALRFFVFWNVRIEKRESLTDLLGSVLDATYCLCVILYNFALRFSAE